MLRRRLFMSIAYQCEREFYENNMYHANEVVIDTQPPFCHVCKQYLTEFACNSIRKVKCPYFESEDLKKNKS